MIIEIIAVIALIALSVQLGKECEKVNTIKLMGEHNAELKEAYDRFSKLLKRKSFNCKSCKQIQNDESFKI